jgi:hypothetical protein
MDESMFQQFGFLGRNLRRICWLRWGHAEVGFPILGLGDPVSNQSQKVERHLPLAGIYYQRCHP